MKYKALEEEIQGILDKPLLDRDEKLQRVCDSIKRTMEFYDWVGFYFADHKTKMLHLGPYAGESTDHTVIPFGKGICGQVAVSGSTFVVDDVLAQDNYISCNINVRSEIVVPIYVGQTNIGQIDIDSNTLQAFDQNDSAFLNRIASKVARLF